MTSVEGKMTENWYRMFGQVKKRSLKAPRGNVHCVVFSHMKKGRRHKRTLEKFVERSHGE